jgi:hypothetical protein
MIPLPPEACNFLTHMLRVFLTICGLSVAALAIMAAVMRR